MPTSRPSMSSSAPPELPGLMDASVWTKSKSVRSPALKFRCTAETTPVVTVCERPNGLPIAMTVSPVRRSSERPIVDERQPLLRLELQHGEVGGRIGPHHLRDELAPVEQAHPEAGAALDDVVVREDVAVGRDDDARAERGDRVALAVARALEEVAEEELRHGAPPRRHPDADELLGGDVHDRAAHLLHRLRRRACAGSATAARRGGGGRSVGRRRPGRRGRPRARARRGSRGARARLGAQGVSPPAAGVSGSSSTSSRSS